MTYPQLLKASKNCFRYPVHTLSPPTPTDHLLIIYRNLKMNYQGDPAPENLSEYTQSYHIDTAYNKVKGYANLFQHQIDILPEGFTDRSDSPHHDYQGEK